MLALSPMHAEHTRVFLKPDLADEVGLVVSQDNSCRYCFGAQRAFLRILGMKEARITRLEQDLLTGDFTPQDRAALEFARRLSRSSPLVSQVDIEALRRGGFSDAEVRTWRFGELRSVRREPGHTQLVEVRPWQGRVQGVVRGHVPPASREPSSSPGEVLAHTASPQLPVRCPSPFPLEVSSGIRLNSFTRLRGTSLARM